MQSSARNAILAGLFAGLAFGIFWLPVRMIEQAGLGGPWASAAFVGVPALFCLPLLVVCRRDFVRITPGLVGGVLAGLAFALYAIAFLYTDVVRAVLLFYLMPVWGFLLGWFVLRDPITPVRWLAIVLGVVGVAVIFLRDAGLPMPRNLGDWCALASGVVWSLGSLLILIDRRVHIMTHTANFFVSAALFSLIAALVATAQGMAVLPGVGDAVAVLPWVVVIAVVAVLPAGYATVYAPSRLNPGVVGLLFMVEIVVATLSAAALANEPIGLREMLGLSLILGAGLIEPVAITLRRRRAA